MPLAALRAAYGATPVVRMIPSVPVEVRQGVTCHARDPQADAELEEQAIELFERVGIVVDLDESQFEVATGLMSCAPAYIALVAEAQVDAGVRAGLPADIAGELVAASIGGTAALLQARGMDTLAVRRSVTSPGGITARGLAALEHGGVRAAFDDAMQAVAGAMTGASSIVATARESIADFLSALLIVYLILIFAYIITSLIFAFGGRIPYSQLVQRRARLPARRHRAVPRALPALHPADRPGRREPDRRDPRPADRRLRHHHRLIRG